MRMRRSDPTAGPAEIIARLERQYVGAIATASAAIAASGIALEIAVGLLPAGGAAAAVGKQAGKTVAKQAGKQVAKRAGKEAAKLAASGVARHAVSIGLPAGNQQAQFEITAIFALALAEIHGLPLEPDQAKILVLGLTSDGLDAATLAQVAHRVAESPDASSNASPRWAATIQSVPGGASSAFVDLLREAGFENWRQSQTTGRQTAIDMCVQAAATGALRFAFGRQVVAAARDAFGEAPGEFPSSLELSEADAGAGDPEEGTRGSRALQALEQAGSNIETGMSAIGSGVTATAAKASRPFRRVDLDGDGIPDDPRALSAARAAGSAIGSRFKRRGRGDGQEPSSTESHGPQTPDTDVAPPQSEAQTDWPEWRPS